MCRLLQVWLHWMWISFSKSERRMCWYINWSCRDYTTYRGKSRFAEFLPSKLLKLFPRKWMLVVLPWISLNRKWWRFEMCCKYMSQRMPCLLQIQMHRMWVSTCFCRWKMRLGNYSNRYNYRWDSACWKSRDWAWWRIRTSLLTNRRS
jgi:hypothetical protein